MRNKSVIIANLLIFSFCVSFFARAQSVENKASIVGKKNLLNEYFHSEEGKMPQIGAVTFIGTADKEAKHYYKPGARLYIMGTNKLKRGLIRIYAREFKNNIWSKKPFWHGYISHYGRPVIDGRDHDLNGNILGDSSGILGVEANTKAVRVEHVKVNPGKRGFDKNLDIAELIDYLKKNAAVTITKDTECNGSGCVYSEGGENTKFSLGTKESPKIVVVDKARLALSGDFKGYGVLILTGERDKVPELGFVDEIKGKRCKITGRTLTELLKEAKARFEWGFLKRARQSLRLTMDDSASWYGIVISDVSSPVIALGRQTYHQYIPIYKPILKDEYKKLKKDLRKPFSSWNFIGSTAYAGILKKEMIPAQPFPEKPELPGKEIRKPECPRKKIRKKIKMPQIGRVRIYGAVLLNSRLAFIRMNSADILYSSEAIDLVDNMISSLPFTWEEYKGEK